MRSMSHPFLIFEMILIFMIVIGFSCKVKVPASLKSSLSQGNYPEWFDGLFLCVAARRKGSNNEAGTFKLPFPRPT